MSVHMGRSSVGVNCKEKWFWDLSKIKLLDLAGIGVKGK